MKNCKSMLYVLAFVLGCTILATAEDAPLLTFKYTKASVPGATMTEPGGINNAGVSAGLYTDSGGTQHGYILSGKKLTTLDDPNGSAGTTAGSNLNPDGAVTVVGSYTSSKTGSSVAFLYKAGKYTDVAGPKGAVGTFGSAINDSGAVVGYFTDSAGLTHGFLLKGKKYKTLDVPGAAATYATGINKSGKIVLFWQDSNGVFESSLYNGKTYKTIDVPGASSSYSLDLNTAGDVCFEWLDSANVIHGALLHAGKYFKFDFPKSTATYGGGINDKGNIIGGYQTSAGGTNWFGFKAAYK
jgi:probable HAF family extracellular repeat protein